MPLILRRSIQFVFTPLFALLVLLAFVGFTYEQMGRSRDRQHPFRIGQPVDVGGRTLNINCAGQGSPVVILEPGAGGYGGYGWRKVQPEVALFSRVCWYDRAGEGWSDPPPTARNSSMIVNDLHEIFLRTPVSGPYILVGHSIGGSYARIYAARFPAEVVGMVLVDSSHPDQHEPPIMLSPVNRLPVYVRRLLCATAPLASRFGIIRFSMRNERVFIPAQFAADEPAVVQAFRDQRVKAAETDVAQGCAATHNGTILPNGGSGNPEVDDAVRSVTTLGNIPLIVLTAGQYWKPDDDPVAAEQITRFHEVWVHSLQADLARLSPQGRQIIVGNSDHGIPDQAPDAVVSAIQDIVTKLRQERHP